MAKEKKYQFKVKNPTSRLEYTTTVLITLKYKNDKPVFSVMAFVGNGDRMEMGGQCLDRIVSDLTFLKQSDKKIFLEIYDLWKRNNLNDLNPGTPKQTKALEECYNEWYWDVDTNVTKNDFELKCQFLKSIDLYEDKDYLVDDGNGNNVPYKYGTKWIYHEISETDLKRIEELLN